MERGHVCCSLICDISFIHRLNINAIFVQRYTLRVVPDTVVDTDTTFIPLFYATHFQQRQNDKITKIIVALRLFRELRNACMIFPYRKLTFVKFLTGNSTTESHTGFTDPDTWGVVFTLKKKS